jgi:type I pantothenate kinase
LQALLSRWPDHPEVDLVTTDGFLYPNAELESRGLMDRKGFPESYDTRSLIEFLRNVKSGTPASAPVYDHIVYDIVPDERVVVDSPDIVIVEGINVLQVGGDDSEFVSDYFDFSIYVDADEQHIQAWYIERFLTFRQSVFQRADSFFAHYADLNDEESVEMARSIWQRINGVNLSENIMPTRNRASLIVRKGQDHRVAEVRLRRL